MRQGWLLCLAALICWIAPLTMAQTSAGSEDRPSAQAGTPKHEAAGEDEEARKDLEPGP